jgi:osmotically-inducible protein OsmY
VHIARCVTKGPLLAGTLGVAAFGAALSASPPDRLPQVVVTAQASDAAMAAKVEAAIAKDPYIMSDHITVTVTNGVVKVGGKVRGDVADLLAILRVARRVAGKARVVNQIDFEPAGDDGP